MNFDRRKRELHVMLRAHRACFDRSNLFIALLLREEQVSTEVANDKEEGENDQTEDDECAQ